MADKTADKGPDTTTDPSKGQTADKAPDQTKNDKPDVDSLLKQMESIKKTQSGLDKKNEELMTELAKLREDKEALEKERMSDREKAEYERKKYEEDLAKREAKIQEQELRLIKTNVLAELKLDAEYMDMIYGTDEKTFRANAERLKKKSDEDYDKRLKDLRLSGQRIPESGTTTTNGKFTKEKIADMTADEYKQLSAVDKAEFDKVLLQS